MSGNDIEITIGAKNDANSEIESIGKTTQKTEKVIVKSMGSTEEAFDTAARGSSKLGDALDKTEGFTGKLGEGIGGVDQAMSGLSDAMNYNSEKARALQRAQQDVEQAVTDARQATEDLNQAQRDGAQSAIDSKQAAVDLAQAQLDSTSKKKAYDDAVKKSGPNSAAARQALIDYKQTLVDVNQAEEDGKQAQRDAQQASIDTAQALTDQKSAATDLSEAQSNLSSQNSIFGKVSGTASLLSGILGGLSGVIGAVTAVQWAWNAAMTANPIGLVVAAIVIVIGIIIYLAVKTKFFQTVWHVAWGAIKTAAVAVWSALKKAGSATFNWLGKAVKTVVKATKSAFSILASVLTAPYRLAFRAIASLWNSTLGKLSFTIPSWVPGIGGAGFRMPKIPSLAVGGDVLKSGLAYIHQGERVSTAADAQRYNKGATGGSHAEMLNVHVTLEINGSGDDALSELLVERLNKNSSVKAAVNKVIRSTVVSAGNGSVQTAYGKRGAKV